jgi:hypothetical protein
MLLWFRSCGSSIVSAATAPVPQVYPAGLGATTIDASFQRITVTSSVVGVIVLLISLAFLYIYTKESYTIRFVDPYQPKLQKPFDPAASGQTNQVEDKK